MPQGVDVSHWTPVRDWDAFVGSGATFFGAKACEGTAVVDPTFAAHRDGFREHCAEFTMAVWYTMFHCKKDPVSQAELLADTVGELGPRERLCLDFEETSYSAVEPAVLKRFGLGYLEAFFARLDSLGALGGTRGIVYTGIRHWQVLGDPEWPRAQQLDLWVARYAKPAPLPPASLPRPWPYWSILQWTDGQTGIVAPVPGIGVCDRDAIRSLGTVPGTEPPGERQPTG